MARRAIGQARVRWVAGMSVVAVAKAGVVGAIAVTATVLAGAALLTQGCARPVRQAAPPNSFDPSRYEVRELAMAGETMLGWFPAAGERGGAGQAGGGGQASGAGQTGGAGQAGGSAEGRVIVIAVSVPDLAGLPVGIYLLDPATGAATPVLEQGQPRSILGAALAGETVVWVETGRDTTARPGVGGIPSPAGWRIMARDLRTGEEKEIDHDRLSGLEPVEPNISADGDRVVWTALEPATEAIASPGAVGTGEAPNPTAVRSVLRLGYLAAGTSVILGQAGDPNAGWASVAGAPADRIASAAVSGDYVVYSLSRLDDEKQATYGAVVLLDLKSGERKTLDEGYRVGSPGIAGSHVVWCSGPCAIKLYDIETAAMRTVFSGTAEVWSPSVNHWVVTWCKTGGDATVAPVNGSGPPVAIGPSTMGGMAYGPFLYWFARPPDGKAVTKYIDFSETE